MQAKEYIGAVDVVVNVLLPVLSLYAEGGKVFPVRQKLAFGRYFCSGVIEAQLIKIEDLSEREKALSL